jgi:hypothetical protein
MDYEREAIGKLPKVGDVNLKTHPVKIPPPYKRESIRLR